VKGEHPKQGKARKGFQSPKYTKQQQQSSRASQTATQEAITAEATAVATKSVTAIILTFKV
jgi:hypothetical protein